MNTMQLLDPNTPFDDNKLAILESIVNAFFGKSTSPSDRSAADKILNQFRALDSSWLACDFILSRAQSIYSKILALGIMEDVIKQKWLLLPEEQRVGIKNFLIDLLIKNVTDDQSFATNTHFINKLNFIIVLIAKHEWTTTWPNFISEICTSSKSNQNLCENNLKLLQMLNEEINEFWKNSMTTSKAMELKNLMAKEFGAVFDLCCFIFENSSNVKQSLLIEAVKLFAENVKWFPLEYVFRDDILSRFLNDIKNMSFIRVQVIKCLGEIFGLPIDASKIGPEQYLNLKTLTLNIYKNFIAQMVNITNGMNFADRYNKLDPSKKSGFEDLALQFALALINFFKNNLSFIEEFDFPVGTANGNDFSNNYMNEIFQGLDFLSQIHQIPHEEIFKSTCEFWLWFSFKVLFIKEKEANPDFGIPLGVFESSLSQYISFSTELFFYKNCYSNILHVVRTTLITKMMKPIEVKIDIDEDGELVNDPTTNTIYQTLHETMRDSLIYLTHLDPLNTEKIMLEHLQTQTVDTCWNPNLLNSICWSIGCIAGAMDEIHEKKFVVMVIKYLLNLCEQKKGKTNKAIVASNIMYVVGQYPRFLNAHWKFLKTVIRKLFEFMHESHPGVQDFACETFLKISIKCGEQLVTLQTDESEPYINVLCRNVKEDTSDLQAHQKLMFYEALGNMIHRDPDEKRRSLLIQNMMTPTYSDWNQIFENASVTPELLQNNMAVKALDLICKIFERVAVSVKNSFWSFAVYIYDNLLKAYMYYSNIINDAFSQNQKYNVSVKNFLSLKKTILKLIQSMINHTEDQNVITKGILPPLSAVIDTYRLSHYDNRDPDVLLVFSAVLEKLKNTHYDYIVSIWQYLCLFTLEMIKADFQSYPEHRQNFFTLVKSLISNAFESLFQVQDSNFNKDVLDAINWAIRHDQPQMFETGLETLLTLIKNVNAYKQMGNVNIADIFFKTYYFEIINQILCVLTDSFHKSGFKLQVEILQNLIGIVEFEQISANLFDANMSNKEYTLNLLLSLITSAFSHLNKVQIEAFCLALFNKCYNYNDFKVVIRDFLTSLKSFSGNQEELFEEEKKSQLEEAKQIEERKRNFIPGMAPVYDSETVQKFKSSNYQTFNN